MQANFCPKGYTGPTRTELREYGASVVLVELPESDYTYQEPRETYTPAPARGAESHPFYAYGGGW